MLADGKRTILLGTLVLSIAHVALARAVPPRKIVVTGELDVLQEDDFQHGHTRRIYRLVEDGGERVFALKFQRKPGDDLITGTKVRVRGNEADAVIAVDPDPGSLVLVQPAMPVAQMRKAVVLLVDFAGDASGAGAAAVSCSDAGVADLMYTRIGGSGGNFDDNFRATSYNQVGWDPNADGLGGADVFRISVGASVYEPCNVSYGAWADRADAAASAAGLDLSSYQHRVYVLPESADCSWAGLANVGCGSSCRAWLTVCDALDVYMHEIGHNLGMGHSSTDVDNDGVVDAACAYWGTSYGGGEYCDRSDFMAIGGDGKRQNDAPHKVQMAWMAAGKLVDASSGTYNLAPLGVDPSTTVDLQVLRIGRSAGSPYYVSYRTNTDAYEDDLMPEYQQKTFVHTHAGGSSNTLLVTGLGDGQTFSDAVSGITITQTSHTATKATVAVSLSCASADPDVSLSASSDQGRPGAAVSYAVLITNRDAAACAASTFSLRANVPSGWASSLSSPLLALGAGQQGSTTLTVTSPSDARDGAYPVSVTAEDPSGSASGGASYCVDGSGPQPVADLAAAVKQKARVQLTWSVPLATGCASLAGYDVFRNGVRIATTLNTGYLDGSTKSGQSGIL